MIYDKRANLDMYGNISQNLRTAVEFIKNVDLELMSEKEFQIIDNRIYGFIRIFEGKAHDAVFYEAHKKFIDIQYIIQGKETIFYANVQGMKSLQPYDGEKDIEFYTDPQLSTRLDMQPGEFAIFFPHDAHKPCCQCYGETSSRKLVIKVETE